jgi:hypothetical protein
VIHCNEGNGTSFLRVTLQWCQSLHYSHKAPNSRTRFTTFRNKIQDYTEQDCMSYHTEASIDVYLTTCFLLLDKKGALVCFVGKHHHYSVPFCIIIQTKHTVTLVYSFVLYA